MKTPIVLVISLLCGLAIPSSLAIGEENILNFLEEFRARMCHPFPNLGLPALDPYFVPYANVTKDNELLVNFTASITNFQLTGLSDFIVNELQISIRPNERSIVNVTLPYTAFKSLYTAYGSLAYIFRFSGNGNAEAFVKQLTVALSWTFSKTKSIEKLKVDVSIEEIFVEFETLIEEPRINDFVHALINELGLELLHDIWEEKQEMVENKIQEKINGNSEQGLFDFILKIIKGDEPIFGPNAPQANCKNESIRLKQQQKELNSEKY